MWRSCPTCNLLPLKIGFVSLHRSLEETFYVGYATLEILGHQDRFWVTRRGRFRVWMVTLTNKKRWCSEANQAFIGLRSSCQDSMLKNLSEVDRNQRIVVHKPNDADWLSRLGRNLTAILLVQLFASRYWTLASRSDRIWSATSKRDLPMPRVWSATDASKCRGTQSAEMGCWSQSCPGNCGLRTMVDKVPIITTCSGPLLTVP